MSSPAPLPDWDETPSAKVAFDEEQSTLEVSETNTQTEFFPTFGAARRNVKPFLIKAGRKSRRVLLGLLLVLVLAYSALNVYASMLLNRELVEIRAKGEPMRLGELAPAPMPDAQNAAVLYQKAFEADNLTDQESMLVANYYVASSIKNEKDVIKALYKNRQAIQWLRQASARPKCRFPVDWDLSPNRITYRHYARLRGAARLMAAQAHWEARNGQMEAALRDVQVVLQMAAHLKDEPTIIGFLVANAIYSIGNRSLGKVLENAALTPAQARAFEQSLPPIDWNRFFRRAMLGERTFTLWAFDTAISNPTLLRSTLLVAENPAPSVMVYTPAALLWRPMFKLDEVHSLRLWKPAIDSLTPMQIPEPREIASLQQQAIEKAPSYAILTRMLLPVYERAREQRDRLEVIDRQRQNVWALICYRTVHSEYPATLQAAETFWGKPLPIDIYSKRPFAYQRKNQSFDLYSIGPNGVDDKGKGAYGRRDTSPLHSDDIMWNPPVRQN
jgi:hypothetical protein